MALIAKTVTPAVSCSRVSSVSSSSSEAMRSVARVLNGQIRLPIGLSKCLRRGGSEGCVQPLFQPLSNGRSRNRSVNKMECITAAKALKAVGATTLGVSEALRTPYAFSSCKQSRAAHGAKKATLSAVSKKLCLNLLKRPKHPTNKISNFRGELWIRRSFQGEPRDSRGEQLDCRFKL